MTEEKIMLVQAVLDGKLDSSVLTLDDVYELQELVFDAVCDKQSNFIISDTKQ